MSSIVLTEAVVQRSQLAGDAPHRLEMKIPKDHAQLPELRKAVTDAIAELVGEDEEAAKTWRTHAFNCAVEDGDNLDISKPWNLGYADYIRVAAHNGFLPPIIVKGDGTATTERIERNKIAAGAVVNVKSEFRAYDKDGSMGVSLDTPWVQFVRLSGKDMAADGMAIDGQRITDAPILAQEEPQKQAPAAPASTPAPEPQEPSAGVPDDPTDGNMPF